MNSQYIMPACMKSQVQYVVSIHSLISVRHVYALCIHVGASHTPWLAKVCSVIEDSQLLCYCI